MCQVMFQQSSKNIFHSTSQQRSVKSSFTTKSFNSSFIKSRVFLQNDLNLLVTPPSQQHKKTSHKRCSATLTSKTSYFSDFENNNKRRKITSSLNSSINNGMHNFDSLLNVVQEGDWDVIQSPLSVFDDDGGSKTNNDKSSIMKTEKDENHDNVFLPSSALVFTSDIALIDGTSRSSESNEPYSKDDGLLFIQLCEVLKAQEKKFVSIDDANFHASLEIFFVPEEIKFDSSKDDCCSSVVSDLSEMDDDCVDHDYGFDELLKC